MLSRDDSSALADRILAAAAPHAEEAEVILSSRRALATRFGGNAVIQNQTVESASATLRIINRGKQARVVLDRFDDDAIAAAATRAVALADAQPSAQQFLPLFDGKVVYKDNEGAWADGTAKAAAAAHVKAFTPTIDTAVKAGHEASGLVQTTAAAVALANSKGIFGYHRATHASIAATIRTEDSSGWAMDQGHDFTKLDGKRIASETGRLSSGSRNAEPIDAGAYDVVLSPDAFGDLIGYYARMGFNALGYIEGRSFMAGKLGEQVAAPILTIVDDAYSELNRGTPFDFDGTPRSRVPLVEAGVARALVHDRRTALRERTQSTGHALPQPNTYGPMPENIVVDAGTDTEESLIAGVADGLLITQFHYTNVTDPRTCTLTGMTRNGTFRIKDGKIAGPVKNLRFTDSLATAFLRIDGLGKDRLLAGEDGNVVCPAARIRQLRFTSSTDF